MQTKEQRIADRKYYETHRPRLVKLHKEYLESVYAKKAKEFLATISDRDKFILNKFTYQLQS